EVLIDRDPQQSIARVLGDLSQATHLRAIQISLRNLNGCDRVTGLLLLSNVRLEPTLVLRVRMSIGCEHREQFARAGRWCYRLKTTEAFRNGLRCGNTSVEQNVLVFLFYLLLYPVESTLANNKF